VLALPSTAYHDVALHEAAAGLLLLQPPPPFPLFPYVRRTRERQLHTALLYCMPPAAPCTSLLFLSPVALAVSFLHCSSSSARLVSLSIHSHTASDGRAWCTALAQCKSRPPARPPPGRTGFVWRPAQRTRGVVFSAVHFQRNNSVFLSQQISKQYFSACL
jgi:hypothetical protein